MKKFASILLALVMILSMATTAFAEETTPVTYTLTLSNALEGHTYTAYQIFAGDLHEGVLSNIVWGSGVTEAGQTALGDAADKAESLATTADAEAFAAAVAPYLGTAAGSATVAAGETSCAISCLEAGYYLVQTTGVTEENGVYTYYIMKVVKDTTATIKADAPEIDKTVSDNDANIGDTVTFTLTATMPSDIQGYETYKVIFHDTLSAGLDFTEGTVKVMIGEKDVTASFTVTETEGVLTVSCDDVLAEAVGATAGSEIVVAYDAVVDSDAVIGTEGNPNKVYLEYSNNPNWDGTGDEPTGETPEVEVKVYTWEIPVFKYTMAGEEMKALAGAGFTLYTDETCSAVVNLVATEDATVYKVCKLAECDHTHVTEVVTGETGKFQIEGLEQGTYYLKETTTPAGYNTCEVVTVVIGADGVLNPVEAEDGTVAGVAEIEVLNNIGATLPETGGMGTTLFYILGAVLVLGAVVLLVTKKRMANAE